MKNDTSYMTFETKKHGSIEMTKDTFVRWLCLLEGIYVAEQKAEALNINLSEWDWVKPLAFEKYIKGRFEGMELDLAHDEKDNNIGKKFVHYSNKPEYASVVPAVY